jgi:tRNA pseudouridine55 synthase
MNWDEGQFILVDKPRGWTSFDVVKKVRNRIKAKIGHAGTLDPLATGLLILATGKFTKRIDEVQGQDKWYEGIISIGKTTPSYDLETEFDSETPFDKVTAEEIEKARIALTGPLSQIPPAYSAVKIDGERAYKKARRKEEVKMRPREITIHAFEITKVELPDIHFRINCTKGTYIRSMAYDFGNLLGVGGYLKELKRTAIGEFVLKDAYDLEDFLNKYSPDASH